MEKQRRRKETEQEECRDKGRLSSLRHVRPRFSERGQVAAGNCHDGGKPGHGKWDYQVKPKTPRPKCKDLVSGPVTVLGLGGDTG